MSMSPLSYSPYYMSSPQQHSSYSSQSVILHHPHEHHMSHQMQPPPPPSPPIPIDPALALYPPPYYAYHSMQQQQMPPPHMSLPPNHSSPSSQGSDTLGTPPMEQSAFPVANPNGKRPSSSASQDSRKKLRKDEDGDVQSPGTEKGEEVKTKPTRGSRACTVCRRLKMKCVGAEHGPPCKRCATGNHECIFEESNRGKRSTKKHEILTRSLRKMERTLDTVLRSLGNPSIAAGIMSRSPSPTSNSQTQPLPSPQQSPGLPHHNMAQHIGSPKLSSLPEDSLNPLGLLAEASLANRRAQKGPGATSTVDTVGVASDLYFKPGPMNILPLRRLYIERQIQPEMLTFVSTEEVVALFDIYFGYMNRHVNLLDPDFHTPSLVCSRSPFLLTTICAIASRFYGERSDLHPKLSELARKLAFTVPAQGYKSVEVVQAYLLNTLWGCGPVERYEQDRTWLLLGMALRTATDLNLHRRTTLPSHQDTTDNRAREREVRNRERTWILCFSLDRSFSAQMGKPYTVKEDFLIRNASQWCRSPLAIPSDVSLAAYSDLQRILTRSLDLLYAGNGTTTGLQMDCDYLVVIKTMESQFVAWFHEWHTHVEHSNLDQPEYAKQQMLLNGKFYFNYSMLVINSFGLQNALEHSTLDLGHFFARCHTSAVNCALVIRDELGPKGYMQYSPDSVFVQVSYAVLSLLKLLRPEFQSFIDHEQNTIALVTDVANVLDNVAVGPLHTPALYSTFVRALISAKTDPSASSHNTSQGAQGESSNFMGQDDASSHALNNRSHASDFLSDFQLDGEMGPVADISTFPPTMAPLPSSEDMLSMDTILSSAFWDSMLVPGYSHTLEGLSGGFVYGAGGTGLITPRVDMTPLPSGMNTPKSSNDLPHKKPDLLFSDSRNEQVRIS